MLIMVCDNVTECNKYHNSPNFICICFHLLQTEFREHFRNISRIMDCVGCDKCKLWGKLQVRNLSNSLSHNKQKHKMFCSTGKYTNHTFYLNFLFLRETCLGKNSKLYNMNDVEKQQYNTCINALYCSPGTRHGDSPEDPVLRGQDWVGVHS